MSNKDEDPLPLWGILFNLFFDIGKVILIIAIARVLWNTEILWTR